MSEVDKPLEIVKSGDRSANFKGRQGRRKGHSQLSVMAKKFVELTHVEGLDYSTAYKQAGYKSKYTMQRALDVLAQPAAKDYIARLNGDDEMRRNCSKSFIIQKLMERLKGAKDSDFVNIVKVLNQMLGYTKDEEEVKINNNIQIIWEPLVEFKNDKEAENE